MPGALTVIACSVLEPEVRHHARGLTHLRDLHFLPQGLHNEPRRLQRELQSLIDRIEQAGTDGAIALVYGLCSRGVENLRHRRCPLVLARAHDCVTLFLGDQERSAAYRRAHPGTYWYTPGWIAAHAPPGPERFARLRREYAAKFEPEEVEYLLAMERQGIAHYDRAAYVHLGVGAAEAGLRYTRQCAACFGWTFDHVAGDPSLIRDLLIGPWDDARFLVVPPDHVIRLTADERIMQAVPEHAP